MFGSDKVGLRCMGIHDHDHDHQSDRGKDKGVGSNSFSFFKESFVLNERN